MTSFWWRDLIDSIYYCCHGEDVSRCLVALRKDAKCTHACVTHSTSQTLHMSESTLQVCGVDVCTVRVKLSA